MEYSVVHSSGILSTPSRFGELRDSPTASLTNPLLLYLALSKALSLPPGEQAQSPSCVSGAGEELGPGERKGVNLRGGLSGGSVGCRFLLQ